MFSIIHVIGILIVVGLIVYANYFDNQGQKLLAVQKFLRKTSRITPINNPKIIRNNRTKIRLVALSLENGIVKPVYMKEGNL